MLTTISFWFHFDYFEVIYRSHRSYCDSALIRLLISASSWYGLTQEREHILSQKERGKGAFHSFPIRLYYELNSSLLRAHFDITSNLLLISLGAYFDFTSSSRWFHFDLTSRTRRLAFEVNSLPLRYHFVFTSKYLWLHFDSHFGFTSMPLSVSLRFHCVSL